MSGDLLESATTRLRMGNYFLDRATAARDAGDKDTAITQLYLAVTMFATAGKMLVQLHEQDAAFIAALPMTGTA